MSDCHKCSLLEPSQLHNMIKICESIQYYIYMLGFFLETVKWENARNWFYWRELKCKYKCAGAYLHGLLYNWIAADVMSHQLPSFAFRERTEFLNVRGKAVPEVEVWARGDNLTESGH